MDRIGQSDRIHHREVDHLHHQMVGMPNMRDLKKRKDFDFNESTYKPLLTLTTVTPLMDVQLITSHSILPEDQEVLRNILQYQMMEELESLHNGHQGLDFHRSQ